MECREFHAMSQAYALGALQAEEARSCEAHLADPGPHEACVEALARSRATVAWLGEALAPIHPGEHVWRHVTLRLGIRDEGRQPMRRREQAAWALALLATAAAAVLWPQLRQVREEVGERRGATAELRVLLGEARQARKLEHDLAAAQERHARGVLARAREEAAPWTAPGATLAPLRAVDPDDDVGAGLVITTPREHAAWLLLDVRTPEAADRRWVVWLLADAAPAVPVAEVPGTAQGVTSLRLDLAAPGLPPWSGVGLSLEPTGSLPTPPTLRLQSRWASSNPAPAQAEAVAP